MPQYKNLHVHFQSQDQIRVFESYRHHSFGGPSQSQGKFGRYGSVSAATLLKRYFIKEQLFNIQQ